MYLFAVILIISSCKRYKDPDPFKDSRINQPYCNDPSAINYNWDFPGVPDNSKCIYPAEIFKGNYFYRDSEITASGNIGNLDSFPITITQIDSTKLEIVGFCGTKIHTAKANRFYTFVLDSLTGNGQNFCSTTDTVEGKGQKQNLTDTTFIKFNYTTLQNGVSVIHSGTATKL
jgi:hypothetical protein